MTDTTTLGGTYPLAGEFNVKRMGFGGMRLTGPQIYGPPADVAEARRVLETAMEAGINHIDTSDFYGPYVVNDLIRETLKPYRGDLVIVTKVGARRTPDAGWHPALSPEELRQAVDDNRKRLDLDVLPIVNLRVFSREHVPSYSPIAQQFETMLELQSAGKIRHVGLSHIVAAHLEEALRLGSVACVQNSYGVLNRHDDPLVELCASKGIAFVPYFPLGGFTPLQSAALDEVAAELGASPHQVALAWLLQRSPNILLIPGTSKVAHLKENIAAADIRLSDEQLRKLAV
ncbi:MAG TPA: oxidoreductase [Bryobacteraceae bacterium]|jgi:aryl-alcohol dehydrogenase-like predicted oxidoreductase|nr:oxidoreductase [Bryobacteraceae bacterium]